MGKKYLCKIIGIVFLLGIPFVGCDNGNDSNNLPQSAGNSVTYKSKDASGNTYTLVITEQETKPKYVVRVGDIYELKITSSSNNNKISHGSVNSANSAGLKLWPFNTIRASIFSITLSNGKMVGISGTITLNDFKTEPAPIGQLIPLD